MARRNTSQSGPNLLGDIPRGNPTRLLSEQTIPQSRFMKQEDIATHGSLDYDTANPNGKILLGAVGEKLRAVDEDRHIMTVAGARSGKSVTLTSNLFFYDGSVVVNDSKGELAEQTAERRAKKGHEVRILDGYNIVQGEAAKYRARYNPLMAVNGDDDDAPEQLKLIVGGMVIESPQSNKDPHWDESATNLLLGLCAYVRFGDNVPDEKRTLPTVRDLLNMILRKETITQAEGSETTRYIVHAKVRAGMKHVKTSHPDIYRAATNNIRAFYETESKERSGILSTTRRHTEFLDYKAMRDVMSGHDFDFKSLKQKKQSIYMVLPHSKTDMCSRWLRILYSQLPDAIERDHADPKNRTLIVMDEFAGLGYMKEIETSAPRIPGHGVQYWFILQDWSQGKALYKDRWESFAANCGVTQFFGNVDLTTTEYISKRLGKTPVVTQRMQDSSFDQQERGAQGRSRNTEMHDLMTSNEISRYFARDDKLKRQLVFWAGKHPMIMQRVEWWNKDAPSSQYFG